MLAESYMRACVIYMFLSFIIRYVDKVHCESVHTYHLNAKWLHVEPVL